MLTVKLQLARTAVSLTLGIGIAAAIWCFPLPVAAQSIGRASAVKNQVQGVRGGAVRTLGTGGSVYNDDTVKTGNDSLAQLLFLDQTTFSVAANSQAVLSRIYRPKTGVATKVMNAVAGAFRFVSGVANSRNNEIKFPQGYITVRGTIVDILAGARRSVIIVDEGAITVHVYASGRAYDLFAGKMLVVYSDGHIDGPLTMDATLMRANANVPFPLFGSSLWPAQSQFPDPFETFDTRKDLNDILNAARSGGNGAGVNTGGGCPPGTTAVQVNGGIFCSPNGPG
ncbi:MAG TPA: FecR family protein [Candidatus Binataceae bacterium]|nr:FecR family protein [Candidatus Binataceae bacterium]